MSPFLSYDMVNPHHRTPQEEWQPHRYQSDKTLEWWYVTGIVYETDDTEKERPYFFAWCPIHMVGEKNLPPGVPNFCAPRTPNAPRYRCVLAVVGFADYHNKQTIIDTDVGFMDESNIWPGRNELCFEIPRGLSLPPDHPAEFTSTWSYDDDVMNLEVSSPRLCFKFKFTGAKRVMWAKDKLGIEGFIQQGSRYDRSYYYSLPHLRVTGQIGCPDDSTKKPIDVSGEAWVDRQWGDFVTMWWEWSSLRFYNGARVNLYSFCNDYKIGSYQKADSDVTQWFDNFTLRQNSYIPTPMGQWLSWGWTYEFKDTDIEGSRCYRLDPLSKDDVHETIYSFFEGPSKLINVETNEQVGFAVTESMDIRHMLNAPIEMRRKCLGLFPP